MQTIRRGMTGLLSLLLMLVLLAPITLIAQEENQTENETAISEEVQVTATRVPEDVEPEPAAITVVPGKTLRDTGARDLAQALSMVAGLSIAPGSDGGPASSVPEFWGLREFDAFLLVVDGVPWGGAFNPDLATLNLNDIERIEILRGAAPVMYGATSFVGVIHVIHKSPSTPGHSADASIGNYSSGNAAVRVAIPSSGSFKQAISANFDSQGFRDDRTEYKRGHALYRTEHKTDDSLFHFDVDLNFLRQDPASPHPREGATLSPLVPLDANHNPLDAKQDEDRYHFVAGYDTKVLGHNWTILGAVTRANRDIIKGFLGVLDDSTGEFNAAGYRQNQEETDVYIDSHYVVRNEADLRFIFGADYLYGKGEAKGENVDYFVHLDGTGAPNLFEEPVQERPQLEDERNFFGLYSQFEWNPTTRWLIQGGLRFNSTHEKQHGEVLPGDAGPEGGRTLQEGEGEGGEDDKSTNRMSGTAGASFLAWTDPQSSLWIFGDYRNSFKPAAIDFGPEAEGEILDPETAQSYEGGLKGRMFNRRFDWQFSVFRMDFTNLVTATVIDGLPALINAGEERFQGIEIETEGEMDYGIRWQAGYSHHSSKFTDFVQEFDGVPTQLAGKRLEMTPEHLAYAGLLYYPAQGVNGNIIINYVGSRFLNKRNTALADAYTTLSLGVGYRWGKSNFRFDVQNATDERDPVAESELGDAQYYRLPARTYRFGWQGEF